VQGDDLSTISNIHNRYTLRNGFLDNPIGASGGADAAAPP
jgi:hypothetical protein